MDALVTTRWLAAELGAGDLCVVDATYFGSVPGGPQRDARAEYEAAHIPGAVFLDLESLADASSDLPSMLPPPDQFAARMESLGVGDGDRIVLYDVSHYHTATRAWWMLRTMGARDVAILDGGLAKWRAEGRPVDSGAAQPARASFMPRFDPKGVRSLDQMTGNIVSRDEQVLDARSPARFSGEESDPRPGNGAGHIPGSLNLPYGRLLNADGTWKSTTVLKAAFDAAGIDLTKPLVTTCGSGITAAVLAFGAHLLGADAALYDGSWSEWGGDPSTPKATGAA
ncbi:MAG: 3-mercaptopyruvate sulfurtransferase [Sphingomonas sp.]|uniref:3-mercaptopyruvate sulfurtransferase n=1 Tax=Sphingomonas sp. TaxID=28214 RepID=UPI00120F4D02|nr:3-mercaptopyruvate sulfurtransferase [Sphingomonas sp.]THD37903.1 MAG: 3-mercaptopyruvate sulfurtransferase [Sphingomonas sp.]